jgi:hypothetical protein
MPDLGRPLREFAALAFEMRSKGVTIQTPSKVAKVCSRLRSNKAFLCGASPEQGGGAFLVFGPLALSAFKVTVRF